MKLKRTSRTAEVLGLRRGLHLRRTQMRFVHLSFTNEASYTRTGVAKDEDDFDRMLEMSIEDRGRL